MDLELIIDVIKINELLEVDILVKTIESRYQKQDMYKLLYRDEDSQHFQDSQDDKQWFRIAFINYSQTVL